MTLLAKPSRRLTLRLEELSDRITPSWTVNDPSNDGDANPKDGKPETANHTITLRSIFDHLAAKGGGGTINFNGPMDIVGSFYYFKAGLTITGIRQSDVPVVTIHGTLGLGSGNRITDMQILDSAGVGLYVQNGNTVKNNVVGNCAGNGICLAGTGNKVTGNFVGVTAAGSAANPNTTGILVLKGGNTIGGTNSADGNVVSGNSGDGIVLSSSAAGDASNCVVIGNRIGTDKTGDTAIPNGGWGVSVQGSSNRIGGLASGEGNQIVAGSSGLGGIKVTKGAKATNGNKIQGNRIGAKSDGLGMFSDGASDPTSIAGISIQGAGGVTYTTIQKNTIVDSLSGIKVAGPGSVKGTLIVGNKIGVGIDMATKLRNKDGVTLVNTDGVNLGQREPANRNIIAGNTDNGVVLKDDAKNTKIFGNYIGTNTAGEDLGNGLHGVYVMKGSSNFIGMTALVGPLTGEINTIAFNGQQATDIDPDSRGHAIQIDEGEKNTIRGNVFHDNAGLSISLTDPDHQNELPQNDVAEAHFDAVADRTVMDRLPDQDTGPNKLLNHPVLMALDPGTRTMTWQLNTDRPNAGYTIDFYSDDETADLGDGQPAKFLSSKTLRTNAQGFGTVTIPLSSGQLVSATATDSEGNTSTFSIVDSDADGLADGWEKGGHGIDFDMDGTVDQPLPGADALKKDLYLEADVMSGVYGGVSMGNVFNLVTQAFANAPAKVGNPGGAGGVNLHINPDIPASNVANTPVYGDEWTGFSHDKNTNFGDGLSDVQKHARTLAFRYTILAQAFRANNGVVGYSGNAELTALRDPSTAKGYRALGGNEFMIAVPGTFFARGPAGLNTVTDNDVAGTLMHELGHTLGLEHGGTDSVNYKPNYQSVMSYNWQMPSLLFRSNLADADYSASWSLDYSGDAQKPVDERSLSEIATELHGIAGRKVPVGVAYLTGAKPSPWFTPAGARYHVMPQTLKEFAAPVPHNDWIRNGRADPASYIVDLNHDGAATLLNGAEDWSRLIYNFRESPSMKDGQHGSEINELQAAAQPGDPSGSVAAEAMVIGSDAGVESRVQVIKPDGTVLYDFTPFAGFTGGVRVAKGDVNGDGTTDFIAAMGPAVGGVGGNTVVAYDGTNGQQLWSATPFGASFTDGINVAAGDTDGDMLHTAEIIVAPAGGTGSSVQVLNGLNGATLATFTAFATSTKGGVTVATGDVNGDGKADIVTGMAAGANPMIRVFNGVTRKLVSSITVTSKSYNGVNVAAGDVNGDGKADIVAAAGGGTTSALQPEIRVYDGAATSKVLFDFLAADSSFKGGVRVGMVKTLEGKFSLLTTTGPGQQPKFRRFGPLSYEANWEMSLFDNTHSGAFVG